jgi:hypothetical protein
MWFVGAVLWVSHSMYRDMIVSDNCCYWLPFGSLSMFVRCDIQLRAEGKHLQHCLWICRA